MAFRLLPWFLYSLSSRFSDKLLDTGARFGDAVLSTSIASVRGIYASCQVSDDARHSHGTYGLTHDGRSTDLCCRELFMSVRSHIGVTLSALALTSIGWSGTAPFPIPSPQELALGVWLIPGGIRANRQPDGNTVIFDGSTGLVVMDTGRHEWHRQAILDFAHARRQQIAAIVNSHWHLDHVSGNPALRAAFPQLHVYASDAIYGALSGFLAASARDAQGYLGNAKLPAEARADIRADLATIRNGEALKPDVVVASSGNVALAGRSFIVNLAPNAATAGDVWIYDERSRIAAVGDLVTLPAPFLDTACPDGWQAALAQIEAAPFRMVVPGHGAPMTRVQLALYRQAFDSFIACAKSTRLTDECASGWAQGVRSLLDPELHEIRAAKGMAAYYVDMLRANGGRSKYCNVPSQAINGN
jgi:glyoxylase-like metal-dependent hydrolase (beta-lactamase superfamily II)